MYDITFILMQPPMPVTMTRSNLAKARQRFRRAARDVIDTYEARRPPESDQVTPTQLNEALEQFFTVGLRIDEGKGETGPVNRNDISQLGDYAITLIADLATWASELDLDERWEELESVAMAVAGWIVHHAGEVRTLEPVVNALAREANQTQDPDTLTALAVFMGQIIHASSGFLKQDLEKSNPGRPWRVLHLNRAIVATRTHNPELMEQVFDDLVQHLPEEAPQFFTEGMQQMEALNYPAPVRQVMSRYFDRWSRPTMH